MGPEEAIRRQLPGVIQAPCHAHLRRNVLDDTPEEWRDPMKDLMDEVLQASSQPEGWRIFEEILDGDRQKMVTVVGEEGQTEEVDAYRKLREEAAPALTTLQENLEAGMLIFPRERGTFPDKSGDPRTLGREAGTLVRSFGPGV